MKRFIRAFLAFNRNYSWVDEPRWVEEDEKAWTSFLSSPTGKKLSLILLNLTLRNNATAIMKNEKALAEACGWAKGYRGCVAVLESLSTQKLNSAIVDYGNEPDEPVVN